MTPPRDGTEQWILIASGGGEAYGPFENEERAETTRRNAKTFKPEELKVVALRRPVLLQHTE
jgi:precorrin-6B methylase 2